MPEMRTFRSRLNKLPIELREGIGEIPYQIGMRPRSRKEKLIQLLNDYHIDWHEVGTGTNRFIVKYDNFALKLALDMEGVADNKQEWAISEMLAPDIAIAYEISKGGNMLISEYVPAFTSYPEMLSHQSKIREILKKWSGKGFLLGDVGLQRINYANWGISADGKPKCIDYAYIFPASMDIFRCICGCKTMTFTDTTFVAYKCTECGKVYEDRELRMKISQEERLRLFENVSGIEMSEEFQDFEVPDKYVQLSNDPDYPDPYDTAMNVATQMFPNGSGFFK